MIMMAAIIHPNKAIPEMIMRRDHGRKDIKTKMKMEIRYHQSLLFIL